MTDRDGSRVKDVGAVVLTVSPSDRSCRVRRDCDGRTFLLNRRKLVRDPAFADDDVSNGARVVDTPVRDVISPRGALRSPAASGRLRFLGCEEFPDVQGDEDNDGDNEVEVLPASPLAHAPAPDGVVPMVAASPRTVEGEASSSRVLQPWRQQTYREGVDKKEDVGGFPGNIGLGRCYIEQAC